MKKVEFVLGTRTARGQVVKVNEKTVLVQLPGGKVIKRHIEKHNVREQLNA